MRGKTTEKVKKDSVKMLLEELVEELETVYNKK